MRDVLINLLVVAQPFLISFLTVPIMDVLKMLSLKLDSAPVFVKWVVVVLISGLLATFGEAVGLPHLESLSDLDETAVNTILGAALAFILKGVKQSQETKRLFIGKK